MLCQAVKAWTSAWAEQFYTADTMPSLLPVHSFVASLRSDELHDWSPVKLKRVPAIKPSPCRPPAGQILTAGKDNLLKVVDSHTFEVRQTFRAPGFAVGTVWCTACMSPDERHVAAGSASGVVYVWEVRDYMQVVG